VITAAPVLHAGRLYVPVSSLEELAAAVPGYACCTFRGGIVALDVATGRIAWKTTTIADTAVPKAVGPGQHRWGPSGAAIWATPTVDAELSRLYVATGDNYTDPVTATSDAILALDLASGAIVWSRQMTPGDAWNLACSLDGSSNCPEDSGPDYDFAAAPILVSLREGGRALIAAQKQGVVYALDPDREGAIRWTVSLGRPGYTGTFTWGPAVDSDFVYVARAVRPHQVPDSLRHRFQGGVYALTLATGAVRWFTPAPEPACQAGDGCSAAQAAALTLVSGALFAGGDDGQLLAYDPATGVELWRLGTLGNYETVNRVPGRGGSIHAAGPAVVGGMVFVNSGYAAGGLPGNVLLALGRRRLPP
jgi:polyvinyl alcohol dehydrogenase (cytochrome)